MDWVAGHYGLAWAPNTRETVRRFTLHQFSESGLVVQNPDQPGRPVNSPKWCYQVEPNTLTVIQAYEQDDFGELLKDYLHRRPGLLEIYAAERALNRIPVTLPDGSEVQLSPGGQNVLIAQIVAEFCSRWTPSGRVLYLGDADAKWNVAELAELQKLGVVVQEHGKMPDLVVHLPDRGWLVLIEAASSHGPVNAKRHRELVPHQRTLAV